MRSPPSPFRRFLRSAAATGAAVLAVSAAWLLLAPRGEGDRPAADHRGEQPAARAAATLGASLPQLLVLGSDRDAGVRAAAFAALDRIAPLPPPPRDEPMASREVRLLRWAEAQAPHLVADLCDLHAGAAFAEYGATLVARCLRCHAGPEPIAGRGDVDCAACHAAIHDDWRGGAHAASLTHLHLPTVDPATREVGLHDFDGRRGIACIACHVETGTSDDGCVAAFARRDCASCHADVQAQWEQWRDGDRPRRAAWPARGVAIEPAATPATTCAGCHARDGDHRFAARRDEATMRDAVALSVAIGATGRASATLVNLCGHALPAGTARRGVAIEVARGAPGAAEPAWERVALLAEPWPGETGAAAEAPLAPGERRSIELGAAADLRAVRLLWLRDRADPARLTVVLAEAEVAAPPASRDPFAPPGAAR